MANETAIQQYDEAAFSSLSQWRPPAQILTEARAAASALVEVIKLKKNPVMFNKEQYLEFEDWQTCARFYGCTVKVEETHFVEFSGVQGFEATAVVLDRQQNEISRAESMCLNDEENWGMRTKYEWRDVLDGNGNKIWEDYKKKDGTMGKRPKGERVEAGSTPTPLFQLRSMAQTRACARALRQVFAWVVVLAGYKPTVAEEIDGEPREGQSEQREEKPRPQVQRKSEKKEAPQEETICAECRGPNGAHTAECSAGKKKEGTPPVKTDEEKDAAWQAKPGHDPKVHISRKQGALLFAIQGKFGMSDDAVKATIRAICEIPEGQEVSRQLLPQSKFPEVLDAVDPEFKFHERPEPF